MQKQPSRRVFKKRYSENMKQIYRKAPIPKLDFNNVSFEITLRHECSPVNLLYIVRTSFPKNNSGVFLLQICSEKGPYRKSRQEEFYKEGVLKNFANFSRKHLY